MNPARHIGRRFLQSVRALGAVAIVPVLVVILAPLAAAQATRKVPDDPCDPSYVPPRGQPKRAEGAPVCPGVVDVPRVSLQASSNAFAATPPPVQTLRAGERAALAAGRTVVNAPSFQMLRDGSSKLVVPMHGVPSVKQVTTRNGVTYVLSNSRVPVHNNQHALLTHHFNTPVSEARLRQFKNDVHLRVDLRASVAPVARLVEVAPGQAAVLEVTFPPGQYVDGVPRDPVRGRKTSEDPPRRSRGHSSSGGGGFGPPVP